MTIAQKLGQISANLESSTRVKEFCALARCVMLAKDSGAFRTRIAKEAHLSDRVCSILQSGAFKIEPDQIYAQRAAVLAGGTAVGDWTEQLASYQTLASAFLESLRNYSAFDRLLAGGMRRVPFRTRIGSVSTGLTASTVPQASAKPISRLTLAATQIDEIKIACVTVMTEDVVRFGSGPAGDLFATELSNAVGVETDLRFVAEISASATNIASGGPTAEHTATDLRILVSQIATGARSVLYLLMTPAIAKALAFLHTNSGAPAFENMTPQGGAIGGVTVIASDGVPSGQIIAVDATQLAGAADSILLETSREASLQLDTSPDSPTSGNTNLFSLWQNNLVGLRAERMIGVERLNSSAVAVLTGANYSGDSPGP